MVQSHFDEIGGTFLVQIELSPSPLKMTEAANVKKLSPNPKLEYPKTKIVSILSFKGIKKIKESMKERKKSPYLQVVCSQGSDHIFQKVQFQMPKPFQMCNINKKIPLVK